MNVLRSVRDLSWTGNPLSTYLTGLVAVNWTLPRLQSLDLSDVALAEVDLQTMRMFHTVQALNMTRCGLQRLLGSGFQSMKQLRVLHVRGSALSVLDVRGSALSVLDVRGSALSVLDVRGSALSVLDVRGSALSVFAKGILQGLDELHVVYADNYKLCCPGVVPDELHVVYADNYKLCCPGVVPDGFNAAHSHAPSGEISSCQALLRSSAYLILVFNLSFTYSCL